MTVVSVVEKRRLIASDSWGYFLGVTGECAQSHIEDWEKHSGDSASLGAKRPDVQAKRKAFLKKHQYDTPYPVAPEICVEVVSPSNSSAEIAEKIGLYLNQGALEVWICDQNGALTFSHRR